MIETNNAQAERAVNIVLGAMRKMDECMRAYGVSMTVKIDCANAIARLAASLDTRPHMVFGDINTMDDGGAEG